MGKVDAAQVLRQQLPPPFLCITQQGICQGITGAIWLNEEQMGESERHLQLQTYGGFVSNSAVATFGIGVDLSYFQPRSITERVSIVVSSRESALWH